MTYGDGAQFARCPFLVLKGFGILASTHHLGGGRREVSHTHTHVRTCKCTHTHLSETALYIAEEIIVVQS